jgi:hypothetical protein
MDAAHLSESSVLFYQTTRHDIQVPTLQCLKLRIYSAAKPIHERTTVLAIAVFSYPINGDGGGSNFLSNVGVILLEHTALEQYLQSRQ